MDIQNLLLKLSHDLLCMLSTEHHIIIFSLLAYLIRYSCANNCYDEAKLPRTCITSPINSALNRDIVASNTCGKPPEGYCYIGAQQKCAICNADNPSLSHQASYMVDRFSPTNITWWQSMTWWTSNQQGLSKLFNPLTVNITLNIKKMYLISGGIYVTFRTERPKQMIIERSRDFGKTWQVYEYFAKNCRSMYDLQPDPTIDTQNPFKEICSELYSGEFPRTGGVVHFDPRLRYQPSDFYNADVHRYLEATNIRLRLEYPGTDGREYINEETTLNQYYYAITDLRVDARCDCNGHGEFCDISKNGDEVCDCHHFTMGPDCGQCLPMYRNRKWIAGNATNANPCQKCECYDHATECTYSELLNQGLCKDCQHNTRGIKCNQCEEKYYRNMTVQMTDTKACIPCDCYAPGIADDGKCQQTASLSQSLGQCNCKSGIYGRRCDECLPGKFGFANPPIGTCFDCSCNIYGTINSNQICDQTTGQCTCKASIHGRVCNTCKDGYYKFPATLNAECTVCPCNAGGALPSCNKITGICACRVGVMGVNCNSIKPAFFFPNFTYLKYEPEFLNANGTFSWYSLVRNYGKYFTGFGYARLDPGQYISFDFNVPLTTNYFMLLRYSLYQIEWFSQILPQGREISDWSGSSNKEVYLKKDDQPVKWMFTLTILNSTGHVQHTLKFTMLDLSIGNAQFWLSKLSFPLEANTQYTFKLVYELSSKNYGQPWPLLIDSMIMMLDYKTTSYFANLDLAKRVQVFECFTKSKDLRTALTLPSFCELHIFTVDLQLYGKALACDCFIAGSHLWNTCDKYGGQCQCKEGYGERACDKCIPGYYGNPSIDCMKCSCSAVGSLTMACDKQSGQCSCKQNAHGLTCSECLLGYYFLSETNPKGCQECFGYGHLSSCVSASGFIRNYTIMTFLGKASFQGWRILSEDGQTDLTSTVLATSAGMEFTVEQNVQNYFSAPNQYLGDQLYSYGQLLEVDMSLYPIKETLAKDVQWHVRLIGNGQIALMKFLQTISRGRIVYTVRLHQDYMVNSTKLSEFQFKAMLGQLTSLHIGTLYYQAPATVSIHIVKLHTAAYAPSNNNISLHVKYIEKATCLKGYTGYSCERCASGYTRVVPGGGPLVNCVPCSCNSRSTQCDPQSGACTNCRPGTKGKYCEKCLGNVNAPACDRCVDGFYGFFTVIGGCKPCDCHLPGTDNGNNNVCHSFSGQCVCNKTRNVGGRQCSVCKENAYNVSLTENLRCQECPTCYGLIEDFILEKRVHILQAQMELLRIKTDLSGMQITPFYQEITILRIEVSNLTSKANSAEIKVTGLNFLWETLNDKIKLFLSTLQGSTYTKLQTLLTHSNQIFVIHNTTMFQHAEIHTFLLTNYRLLQNTVRARMEQHAIAIGTLRNLGAEMEGYLRKATTTKEDTLSKKYDLIQKIKLSIEAASTAAEQAEVIRANAFNLTVVLTPVNARALEVEKYAKTCVSSIDSWLTNASTTLVYAQSVLRTIELNLPDHSSDIANLKATIISMTSRYKTLSIQITILSRDITTISHEITVLKRMSLHLTQISFIERTLNRYGDNLRVNRDKAAGAVQKGKEVQKEAIAMLNIVENFEDVAKKAQQSAQEMLKQIDLVKSSVDSTHAITTMISKQLAGPVFTANTALQIMNNAKQLMIDEKTIIGELNNQAMSLKTVSQAATDLIQDQKIRRYITNYLTPLVTQCAAYTSNTKAALISGTAALATAKEAKSLTETTAQKVLLLAANVNNLQTINTDELDKLNEAIIRARSSYQSMNLNDSITKLRKNLEEEKTKVKNYKNKNKELKRKIDLYKLLLNSIPTITC